MSQLGFGFDHPDAAFRSDKVRDFIFRPVSTPMIKSFVETHHYSGSINGLHASYCFGLFNGDQLIGAMIFGSLGMAGAWKKYGEKESDVVELKRLCCIDDTPKNTESFFIGKALRYLSKHSEYKTVVSFADTHFGHEGVIYKASNFIYVGKTMQSRVIQYKGKQYHDKCIRTYAYDRYGNKNLKPFAKELRQALASGEAVYENRPHKNIYTYSLER